MEDTPQVTRWPASIFLRKPRLQTHPGQDNPYEAVRDREPWTVIREPQICELPLSILPT